MNIATWRISCATAALFASSSAMAQVVQSGPVAPQSSSEPVHSASTQFGDIVVTAQRRSERLHDVPITIIAQSGEDLAKAGVTNIRELGQTVPGLTFTTLGNLAEPTIRGVHTDLSQAGGESPVAIYLDGIYQPNQTGNLFDLPDIERIEVLKGPQGTLFGRNATAGAIAIHTLEPSFSPSGHLTVSDGIYFGGSARTSNDFVAKGYVSGPLVAQTVAASIAGYYENVDGYLTNDVTARRSGAIEKYLIRGKLRFEPTAGIRFLLTGSYRHNDDEAAQATQPLRGNTSARFYADSIVPVRPWHVAGELENGVSQVRGSSHAISLQGAFDVGQAGTLTSLTGYTKVNTHYTADVDAAYSPSCLVVFGCIIYDVPSYSTKTFQQELNFASQKFGAFSFVVGAFYYRDNAFIISNVQPPLHANGSVDYSAVGPFYIVGRVRTKAVAGYGELTFDVTDSLHLIGGVRYNWERKSGRGYFGLNGSQFDFPVTGPLTSHAWTPRLSARYDISSSTNLYATYSKGFKSGVLDTTGLSNTVAKPEHLTSYEVGIKVSTATFNLNANAFYYDYKDRQVQVYNGAITILANAATARLYGFELDSRLKVGGGFQLRLGGSWEPHAKYREFNNAIAFELPNGPFGMSQIVIDASGKRVLKAPKLTANASLGYDGDLAGGSIDGNVNLYYSSSYNWEILGRVKTSAYATVNAQLGYTPAASRFRFGIYGKNLTNKAFIGGTVLAGNADAVIYAPPRQIGASIDYAF